MSSRTRGVAVAVRAAPRIAQTFAGVAEAEVGGPEVVPPLGDAVGLVDAEEGRPRTFNKGRGCGRLERLGRRENDQAAALLEPFKRSPSLGRAQPAVKRNHRDAAPFESVLLIGHEGNERRDNNRRPIKNHRWDLVDQRLAKARRQRHQCIASVENGEHRQFLLRPQALDAKGPARGLPAGAEQVHSLSLISSNSHSSSASKHLSPLGFTEHVYGYAMGLVRGGNSAIHREEQKDLLNLFGAAAVLHSSLQMDT